MKPIHMIAGVGVLLILGLGGWYFYMQKTPPYETATERGLDTQTAKPAADLKAAPGEEKK